MRRLRVDIDDRVSPPFFHYWTWDEADLAETGLRVWVARDEENSFDCRFLTDLPAFDRRRDVVMRRGEAATRIRKEEKSLLSALERGRWF